MLEAGVRAVLQHFGFRRRLVEIDTRLLTRGDRISPKCSMETVASISCDGKINTELVLSIICIIMDSHWYMIIEFKLRDHLGNASAPDGSELVMGQKAFVLCGDPKQVAPIGDEPIYQYGEYIRKSQNKPKDAQGVPHGAWSINKSTRMGMTVRDSCEDVVILRNVHRYQDFDESIPLGKRSLYADEAALFLLCTRGMADCTWTRA